MAWTILFCRSHWSGVRGAQPASAIIITVKSIFINIPISASRRAASPYVMSITLPLSEAVPGVTIGYFCIQKLGYKSVSLARMQSSFCRLYWFYNLNLMSAPMKHLPELIHAYETMDDIRREELRSIAIRYAALWPAPVRRAVLSLVADCRSAPMDACKISPSR